MFSVNFKKVKILFYLIISIEIVSACCNCDTEYIAKEFSTCKINLSNLDNTGKSAIVSDKTILNKNAYGIRVSIDKSENKCELSRHGRFSLLSQSLYAFDCDCAVIEEFNANNKITGFKVITLNNFSPEYPKDSDITQLFVVEKSGFSTPNDFIASDVLNLITVSDFENLSFEEASLLDENRNFDLFLKTAPSENIERQFSIIIEFADGTEMSAITPSIILS